MDSTPRRKGLIYAFTCERNLKYDTCERFRLEDVSGPLFESKSPPAFLINFVAGPMWTLDEIRLLRVADASVIASACSSMAQNKRKLRKVFPNIRQYKDDCHSGGKIKCFTRKLSGTLMSELGRAYVLHFRSLANRRMAALASAIRLYEVDHGRRPAKLANLVGKYIKGTLKNCFRRENERNLCRQGGGAKYPQA